MLTEIKLYGNLGKKFGKSLMLDVKSVKEALAALAANFKDFPKEVLKNEEYYIFIDSTNIKSEEIINPTGRKTIKIVPVTKGSGSLGGLFKIIVGALIIYFSAGAATPWVVSAGQAIGGAIIMSGITEMFFSPPSVKTQDQEPIDSRASYLFSGTVNTVSAGNPIPVGYGRLIVGSSVISASISTSELPT